MALVSKNPVNTIFSLKNFFLSISVVFIAFILTLYVPIVFEYVVSYVPILWTTLGFWFTPPYVYVVVNFIIIAIAASSRFQHKLVEGASDLVAPMKIPNDFQKKNSFDSYEYKKEFEPIEPDMYTHLEGNKELELKSRKISNELELKRKKVVEDKPQFEAKESLGMYGYVEARDVKVKPKRKPVESKQRFEGMEYRLMQVKNLEEKRMKKQVESQQEFEVMTPRTYGRASPKNNLEVKNKMEVSAKEDEDKYARSKSVPNRTNTIEIPMDYSFSEEKSFVSHRFGEQKLDGESLQAGKEVSATEAEENDTLEGTWKMIMESRRIHNAGLQEAPKKVEMFKKSNNLRSPSQSTRKQDTFNW